jgi:hypothetical protein
MNTHGTLSSKLSYESKDKIVSQFCKFLVRVLSPHVDFYTMAQGQK